MSDLDIHRKNNPYDKVVYALCHTDNQYVVDALLQQWQNNVFGRRMVCMLLDTLVDELGERATGLPQYHDAMRYIETP
jgi:hypothetical protein